RQRSALQLVEPIHLIAARAWYEQVGEQLAVHRIVLAPALPRQHRDRLAPRNLGGIASRTPSPDIAPIEHKAGNLLRMPYRVFDRKRAALRDSKQDKTVETAGFDHALEVAD